MNQSSIRIFLLVCSAAMLVSCTKPAQTGDPESLPDRVASAEEGQNAAQSAMEATPTPTPIPTPEPYDQVTDTPAQEVPSTPQSTLVPTPTPTPTPAPTPTPTAPSVNTQANVTAPSIETLSSSGQSLQQWIADNVSADSEIQRWVLTQYQSAGADTRWQPAVIALKQQLEAALHPDDYAGIDYVSVTRTATDGYAVTLYTGLQIYTVNDDKANAVIASVMQGYDQSAGKAAIITTHVKRPLSRLRALEQEIRAQSFFKETDASTGSPIIQGFSYEKGGLVVLLRTSFSKLSSFIDKHPDGAAIGYRTGAVQQTFPTGSSTSSSATGSGTSYGNTSYSGGTTNYASMGLPSVAGYSSLEQYLNAISDTTLRNWVKSVYTAYGANLGWNNAVAQLRGSVISALADTEYASVDFLYEIYPYDPNIAIAVGFEVYAVSRSRAQTVVNAAKSQVYNDSVGQLQIKYSDVRLSKKDLEDTMTELERQPFFRNKASSGKPYVVGWFIKNGTVEIWLTEKFPALDAWLDAHPNGHAIGYITGKSL